MTWVSIVTDSGRETSLDVARNDLVAEVKAKIVYLFPFFRGQMLSLSYKGKEMADETTVVSNFFLLGDFTFLLGRLECWFCT